MKRKTVLLYGPLCLALTLFLLYFFFVRNSAVIEQESRPDYKHYPFALDSLAKIRSRLAKEHASITKLESSFISAMDKSIFTYWYGTNWDFNGTTQKPNQGTIACGYFVTTTLRDAGFPLNRVKLAQCPSEEMIKSLVTKESITRFSDVKIADFEKRMNKLGKGLYVVGLDNHTGFILVSQEGNYFIHSSGWFPFKVIKETLSKSAILDHSHYKIVGKLSGDKAFLKKWVGQ